MCPFRSLSLRFRLPTSHLVLRVRNPRRQHIQTVLFRHLHSLCVKMLLHHINLARTNTMDSMKSTVGPSNLTALVTVQSSARA